MRTTDKARRAKCDAGKRERGLFKPTVWVHRDNVEYLREICEALQEPIDATIVYSSKGVSINLT